MQLRDGHQVLSPTDVTKHVACPHVTTLDLGVLEGRVDPPAGGPDATLELIFAKGLEHEAGYLASLHDQGLRVVEIPEEGSLREREEATVAAMRAGADVVYQATLFDGAWVGFADFLVRVERPSDLGAWSYDIADTKLARRLKVPALLQMATYAVRLEQLQGVPPAWLTVVAGDGTEHPWRLVDVDAYTARVRHRLRRAIQARPPTEPVPTAYCEQCRWLPRCSAQWVAADDLSLVAGMRSDHRSRLISAGVPTLTELARTADGDERLRELSSTVRTRLRRQAGLQLQERTTGAPAYELLPAQPGQGLLLLPEPDPGDVYLDFEGDPFAPGGQGLEYLAGVYDRDGTFWEWWAHDAAAERELVADLLGWLLRRWEEHPGMHVYHYAAYEQTALKRLTAREAVAETELDVLLRGERLVDLYAVVRQGLAISKESYSIKALEAFYWGRTRRAQGEQVGDAMSSIVQYEQWASSDRTDDTLLRRIADYNRDDVASTLALHDWLEERRTDLARVTGAVLLRPEDKPAEEARDSERIEAENLLAQRLQDAGHDLLAGCVGWHRREDKQTWWEFFRTRVMSEEELVEDRLTLGGLGPPQERGTVKRSVVWRYDFLPQETRIGVGTTVAGAHDHERVGEVVGIDLEEGWVEVKRGRGTPPPHATGFVADDIVNNNVLRDALVRLGEQTLAGEMSTGGALLGRVVPSGMEPGPGESAADVVRRVGAGLHGQVLAVQGPPGAGKTYAGSHLIADLLDAGLTVGVTAPSHSVLTHLLRQTGRPALRKGTRLPPPEEVDPDDPIELAADNDAVRQALADGSARLVGGTAWLWAREEMRGSVDVLVIDEAGQFSLANALAVAQAAGSMVLLGDPQQLAAPSRGTHPYGAGVSVLEHLLEDQAVIGADRGVFLDRTWRMHPQITDFVSTVSYDGRLGSAPGLDRQRVGGGSGLSGSGLRWVPVEHQGHSSDNPVEAEVVADLVQQLLGTSWTDQHGDTRGLTPADVLVVAPYNAHVAGLTLAVQMRVGAGVEIGTVDKFQGREGAVVIYSMCSSSAADAPRGVDFLYDPHRLNVAVSRARAVAVIVASPALLEAPVRDPEQLRAVNALCRFVDAAGLGHRG